MDFATKIQVRRLYYLLHKRRLDVYTVDTAIKNICTYFKILTIGDISDKQIIEAYKLVDKIDEFGEIIM
ncbi:MAG: hypothetical protein NTY75_00865 [Candidatus Shapirobacteria bacterium]|nr:hypothetical protein [Candidatus Shapirobacteria bacterium]